MARPDPRAILSTRTSGSRPVIVVDMQTANILPLNVSVPRGTNSWIRLVAIHLYDTDAAVTISVSNNNVVTTMTHRYSIHENMTAFPGARVILIT